MEQEISYPPKSMLTWPKATIRTVATGNVAVGAMGLWLQSDSVIRFSRRHQFISDRPYETHAYWVTACVTSVLVLLTLASGFFLWGTRRRALRLCNWRFGSELVYWFSGAMLDVVVATSKNEWAHHFVMSFAAVAGIGNMGLSPQVFSLYPVWALVILNVAYWRMEKSSLQAATS